MLLRFAFSGVMLPNGFKNSAEALELVARKVRMDWQRHGHWWQSHRTGVSSF